jgi:DNA-directed RNA polymerase specialized sigma24 family protein
LSEKVLDQQLKRLEGRWAAAILRVPEPSVPKGSKHQLKGAEGLRRKKIDLSRYMHGLTDKQEMAFSLKQEYGLGLTEIASRMGVDRKTAYEHIQAAATKIDQIRSGEKRKANRAKGTPEE